MKPSVELLGHRTGNCFRAAIALEEAGLEYTVRRIDMRHAEHRGAEFLALNPAGKVPVLIDRRSAGSELVIAQSNAIMIHAAETSMSALVPATGAVERARFFERLFYFLLDVIAPSHGAFALRNTQSAEAVDLLNELCLERLEAAERFLEEAPFLSGAAFTLVDIAAFTIASSVKDNVDWSSRPRLREWFEVVAARPAVVSGLRAFD